MNKTINKLFSASSAKWWWRVLTVVVTAGFTYQFYVLYGRVDWAALLASLRQPENGWTLLLVLLLMPLNWLLEARKWQLLLRPFLRWPFRRVVRTVLAGVSVSAVTPNRVGEVGGRLLVVSRAEAPAVLLSSVLGSLCQWIAFLLLAWPALVWTANDFLSVWLLPLGPVVVLLAWWGGQPVLRWLLARIDARTTTDLTALRRRFLDLKFALILRAGAYACVRFGVYCTQLYLLLRFFGLYLPFWKGLAGIAGIYLVQAGIPLPPGLNLVTRTELGMLLWEVDANAAVAVLGAFTTLFFVNVLLPALPAYWLIVLKHKRHEVPLSATDAAAPKHAPEWPAPR